MAFLEKNLFVKKSKLPNAGKGLYTKVDIPKGTRMVEYKGRIQPWREVKDEDGINGYLMYINRNVVINGLVATKSLARYANDAGGLVRLEGVRNNSEFISEGKRCYIDATRNIKAGEEIFASYGREYWALMKRLAAASKINNHLP